jgi:hypothetical protein
MKITIKIWIALCFHSFDKSSIKLTNRSLLIKSFRKITWIKKKFHWCPCRWEKRTLLQISHNWRWKINGNVAWIYQHKYAQSQFQFPKLCQQHAVLSALIDYVTVPFWRKGPTTCATTWTHNGTEVLGTGALATTSRASHAQWLSDHSQLPEGDTP